MSQTTTLIAALRNEGPFVLEWVAYHRAIGFDHIVLYADDSVDGSDALLAALAAAGIVTVVPCGPQTGPAKGHRHRAYARALTHPLVQSADWVMALDLDEYLTVHAGEGRLDDLFDAMEEADVISPAWRVFGNSGIVDFTDAPLTPRFVRAAPADAILSERHLGLKSLFRPAIAARIGPHRPAIDAGADVIWRNGSGVDVTRHLRDKGWAANGRTLGYDLCQISHYMIRANAVFALHHLSGQADVDTASPMTVEDYRTFNANHTEDHAMLRWADVVTAGITDLRRLPDVAAAHDACVAAYNGMIAQMRETANDEIAGLLSHERARGLIADQVKWLGVHRAKTQATNAPLTQAGGGQNPTIDTDTPAEVTIDADDVAPRWLGDLRRSDYRKGWYYSDEKFAAQYTKRSADTLVVSFDNLSSVNDPALSRETWGYGFYRAEGWSHMGVMAFEKNWFRDEALFDFMGTTAKGVFAQYKNVVLTGTSMGAYAATAFSKLAPGCTVVAFSPQSTLDKTLVPWEERFGSGRKQDWSGRYRDAPDDCGAARDVFIIYDPYFAPDRLHAERYYGDNISFLKSWYSSHKSAQFMRRADILKSVMQEAVAGTLTTASYYRMFRARRDLIWYYNGLAEHLIGAGHDVLARRLSDYLAANGRPGVARGILGRLDRS